MSTIPIFAAAAFIAASAMLIRSIAYWVTRAEHNRIRRAARLGPRAY